MRQLKLITYNVDGLPEKLDLNDLPWILKPIAWIYRLFKKTTVVTINDDTEKGEKMYRISSYLDDSGADIIAVQEDFNYHSELMTFLYTTHTCSKHTGGFNLKKLWSSVEFFSYFPLPRFKTDGLSVIMKEESVILLNETIVPWRHSNGYISHGNDLLTHKGFRLCELMVNGYIPIDVYNVHMDADFYDKDLCPDVDADIKARREQLIQLLIFIFNRHNSGIHHPIIIMGDTNCSPNYAWDIDTINEYLLKPFFISNISLEISEISCADRDVDRIFIINDSMSEWKLEPESCMYDKVRFSDHLPFVALLNIETNDPELYPLRDNKED